MRRLGLDRGAALDVVLVGDLSDGPDAYLAALREHGAEVHVATELYLRLADEFPNVVSRFAGPYGIFSFALLRWLLVDALFPGEPVACYDGDVIHSMPLTAIADAIDGRTGTATSTAFTVVSDRSWFESWRRNLERLEEDMDGFWRRAADATGFAALPEVYRYSAEEYFAKALIEAGELPGRQPAMPGCWLLAQPQYLPRLYAYTRAIGSSHAPTPLPIDVSTASTSSTTGPSRSGTCRSRFSACWAWSTRGRRPASNRPAVSARSTSTDSPRRTNGCGWGTST